METLTNRDFYEQILKLWNYCSQAELRYYRIVFLKLDLFKICYKVYLKFQIDRIVILHLIQLYKKSVGKYSNSIPGINPSLLWIHPISDFFKSASICARS
ncbi:hypothetical protein LEP1GSC008_0508 [Leptospira kirschneri serovar Bulgarica str. Nikolaevo]|uniref:Uncharacterized protein n=1 Tax=Leptospira kirschneri serovar Bulgarica str. Nikolaevo TaxID=1240687 RepID=M6F5J5_9LEPT|nr:hypothetical protein LEP1GSC008_0508 [Leptospira kirschneri serovar Bulgarica str. Nikolaevo]